MIGSFKQMKKDEEYGQLIIILFKILFQINKEISILAFMYSVSKANTKSFLQSFMIDSKIDDC